MDVRAEPQGKLSTKKMMLLNCGVGKTLESPLDFREIQPIHSKGDQPWDFFGRNIGGILHNGILVDIKKV